MMDTTSARQISEHVVFFDTDCNVCESTFGKIKTEFYFFLVEHVKQTLETRTIMEFPFVFNEYRGWATFKPLYTHINHELYSVSVAIKFY